jgi:ribose transport system permease protein
MKKELGIFTLLLVLCGVTAAINPRFLSATNLTNMANIIGLFGIFSLGLGMVIITGGIDLSVGSMFALAGVLLSMFLTEIAWPFASWELKANDLKQVPALVEKFQQPNPVSQYMWGQIPDTLKQDLIKSAGDKEQLPRLQTALAGELNRVIAGPSIYDKDRFAALSLSSKAKGLIEKAGGAKDHSKLNRLLIQSAFGETLTVPREFWPWPFAAAVAILIPMLLGWAHGALITRMNIQPFIVTLCGLLLYRGLARYIADDGTKGLGNAEGFETFASLAKGKFLGLPAPFVILIVLSVIMWFVLHRSMYGRYLLAVGRNENAARFSGINTRAVIATSYILMGLLTGIAGILFAFYTNSISPSNHGNFFELYGIAAAVLGGCSLRGGEGSVIGILIGTALLQVLQNLVNLLGIPSSLNFAVMGAVVLIGVLADQYFQERAKKKLVKH